MRCKDCGKELAKEEVFCGNCGKRRGMDKKILIIILSVIGVIVLFFIVMAVISVITMSNFLNNAKEDVEKNLADNEEIYEEYDNMITDSKKINYTTWVGSSGSYISFSGGDFNWYQTKDDYNNYYTGEFTFKSGAYAYDYITINLSDYYITTDELDDYFERNIGTEYNLDNLVVLVLDDQALVSDGVVTELDNSYYYGFLLDSGNTLELVNMNTFNTTVFNKE